MIVSDCKPNRNHSKTKDLNVIRTHDKLGKATSNKTKQDANCCKAVKPIPIPLFGCTSSLLLLLPLFRVTIMAHTQSFSRFCCGFVLDKSLIFVADCVQRKNDPACKPNASRRNKGSLWVCSVHIMWMRSCVLSYYALLKSSASSCLLHCYAHNYKEYICLVAWNNACSELQICISSESM